MAEQTYKTTIIRGVNTFSRQLRKFESNWCSHEDIRSVTATVEVDVSQIKTPGNTEFVIVLPERTTGTGEARFVVDEDELGELIELLTTARSYIQNSRGSGA